MFSRACNGCIVLYHYCVMHASGRFTRSIGVDQSRAMANNSKITRLQQTGMTCRLLYLTIPDRQMLKQEQCDIYGTLTYGRLFFFLTTLNAPKSFCTVFGCAFTTSARDTGFPFADCPFEFLDRARTSSLRLFTNSFA